MTLEYHWWDLGPSIFKGELLDTIGSFYLYDFNFNSWNEFETAMPHMAYTHLVSTRFNLLEQQFVDLRIIPQMLGIEVFPVHSTVKPINRYEWLKSINDLKLMRFSSIRDLTFRFVNELLELKLSEYSIRIGAFEKQIANSHPDILMLLQSISRMGSEFRDDRNLRVHEGHMNSITEDDGLFKFMSYGEEHGSILTNYDLDSEYVKAIDKMYQKVVDETELLLAEVILLADKLLTEFDKRYFAKRPTDFKAPIT